MIILNILSESVTSSLSGEPIARHVNMLLWDDVLESPVYKLGKGGLPLDGDLEVILNPLLGEFWSAAVEKNDVLSISESLELNYTNEGKQWFQDHPNAILLFELSMGEIETRIDAWDLSSIPNPARNDIKLTIQALVASVRVLAHQLNLLD